MPHRTSQAHERPIRARILVLLASEYRRTLINIAGKELRTLVGQLPIAIVPLTEPIAWGAAELRARHYHRRRSPVSIADCVLVASAEAGDRVATKDSAVLEMACAEGVAVLELA